MRSRLLRFATYAFLSLTTYVFPLTVSASAAEPVQKPAPNKAGLETAHVHIQKGRLAEALELYDKLEQAKVDPVAIAVGRSRCYAEQGQWNKAGKTLQKAIESHPHMALLYARLADVQFRQGEYDDAEQTAEKAIQLDAQQPLARLVLADVYTETGRIKQALEGYRWFVRYYNRAQPTDAKTLLLVARGSLQYARWKSVSQIFGFVINTLCPDALKADENSWRAYYLSGDVLLEKYNRAQALPELQRALTVNPRAVPALVSLGEAARQKLDLEQAGKYAAQALKIAPNHVPALQLKADVLISRNRISEAEAVLKKALDLNPREQRTLGRLAACYLLIDGPPPPQQWNSLLSNIDAIANATLDKPDRFSNLVVKLAKRNPRPGYFLTILGDRLEARRKFHLAERCYKTAIRIMPELSEPKTSLGLLYMRIGRTTDAQKILDDAFRSDPFHVRVSNMRKVLKVLDGYDAISTEHFVIRVDSQADAILGQYMAEYLEQIYPKLTKRFGFEPPHRTQFEVYHNAKGLSGHEWFSARLIGLPWIHTIGASTGMIVALTSPTASDDPYNWARVVRHEFVHVITLQQTKFNIPHWFTEALAVTAEGYPRPETWNRLLLERVPKGELRTLKTLSDGFIRPRDSLDWQFAYCQSRLYAEYLVETYGADSIPKMLEAYRRNLSTEQAVQRACGVDLETFEKGYRAYLKKVVGELKTGNPVSEKSSTELAKDHEANPDDTEIAGQYAYVLFQDNRRKIARQVAEKALATNPNEPLAAYVMARLSLLAADRKTALKYLEAAHDASRPVLPVIRLLGQLKLENEKYGEAGKLLELGRKHFAYDEDLMISLARVYLRLDNDDKLKDVLNVLAARNFDDAGIRKKLTEIAFKQKDYKAVVRHGRSVLFIDVLDIPTHGMLGTAYRKLKDYEKSVREFQVALQLKPGDADLQVQLAKTHIAADEKGQALKVLNALLQQHPDNAVARMLRESLQNDRR